MISPHGCNINQIYLVATWAGELYFPQVNDWYTEISGSERVSPWPRDSFLHPRWFSVETGWHVRCVEVISCLSGIIQRVNDCGIIFSLISLLPCMGGLTKEFILSSLWFKSFQCAECIVLICAYNCITSCGTDLVRKCSFQFSLQIGNFPAQECYY